MSTVLLIEDEPYVRLAARRILEAAGHTVHEAENGIPGLELFRLQHPDLVITDIVMPEKEGLETIREMRQVDPTVPIIAMAYQNVQGLDFLHAAERFGATATIAKPIRRAEFLACVADVLSPSPLRLVSSS